MTAMLSSRSPSDEPYPRLRTTPIVEALIDWRAAATVDLAGARSALETRLPDYPSVDSLHQFQWSVNRSPTSSTQTHDEEWLGYRLDSEDRRHVAQFTKYGFTFSRLAPYDNWDSFAEEALRLWTIYREIAHPDAVDRLGVRFVNRLLRVRLDHLSATVTATPTMPFDGDASLEHILLRTVHQISDAPLKAIVTLATEPAAPPATGTSLLVDIDVFSTSSLDCDRGRMQERLQSMRRVKNHIFFSLLTETAIEELKRETR